MEHAHLPPPKPRALDGKISISGRETFEMRLFMHEGVSINSQRAFIWWLFSGDGNGRCYFSIKLNMEATGLCMPGWHVHLVSFHACFIFKPAVSLPECLLCAWPHGWRKSGWLENIFLPPLGLIDKQGQLCYPLYCLLLSWTCFGATITET